MKVFLIKYHISLLLLLTAQSIFAMDGRDKFLNACHSGNLRVVRQNAQYATDADCFSTLGYSGLHYAASNQHNEILKFLIAKGADVNEKTKIEGFSPLMIAMIGKNYAGLKLLIDAGGNVDQLDNDSNSLLHHAATHGNYELAGILLKGGAKPNITNKFSQTPLHFACFRGKMAIAKELIAHGANLHAAIPQFGTPFHAAVFANKLDLVSMLLGLEDGKLLLNDVSEGKSPLHLAVFSKNMKMSQLLVQSGARADITANGLTPMDLAYWIGDRNIIALLARNLHVLPITDEEAEKNMLALFAEIEDEATQSKKKRKRRGRKKQTATTQIRDAEGQSPTSTTTVFSEETTQIATDDSASILNTVENIPACIAPVQVVTPADATSGLTPPAQNIAQVAPVRNVIQPRGYRVLQHEKLKWPKGINATQRKNMVNALKQLKHWPTCSDLDITHLKGNSGLYRVRINSFRVIFSVDNRERDIKIHEIGLRKSIYKNLSSFKI